MYLLSFIIKNIRLITYNFSVQSFNTQQLWKLGVLGNLYPRFLSVHRRVRIHDLGEWLLH